MNKSTININTKIATTSPCTVIDTLTSNEISEVTGGCVILEMFWTLNYGLIIISSCNRFLFEAPEGTA